MGWQGRPFWSGDNKFFVYDTFIVTASKRPSLSPHFKGPFVQRGTTQHSCLSVHLSAVCLSISLPSPWFQEDGGSLCRVHSVASTMPGPGQAHPGCWMDMSTEKSMNEWTVCAWCWVCTGLFKSKLVESPGLPGETWVCSPRTCWVSIRAACPRSTPPGHPGVRGINFASFFLIWMLFITFYCLIALERISSSVLIGCGVKSTLICDLSWKQYD